MSSQTISTMSSFETNLSPNLTQMSENESKVMIIERIIAILSENKLKSWFDVGIRDEYQSRYGHSLPDNWIQVLQECGRDVIDVSVINCSNVTKTLIALPIRSVRKSMDSSTPMDVTSPTKPMNMAAAKTAASATSRPNGAQRTEQTVVPNVAKTTRIQYDPKPVPQMGRNDASNANQRAVAAVDALPPQRSTPSVRSEDMLSGDQRPIPAPILPSVNPKPVQNEDFFDLVVLLVATPKNFIVVPFDNVAVGSAFLRLKQSMQEFYETDDNRIELSPTLVRDGLYVAGKTRDTWYRMQVRSVICRDPFQVMGYLCDYGEHLTVDIKDIQPLYSQFRDLPAQAIRASLADVEPVGSDWDVMTSIEFRRMVEKRPFVGTVFAISQVDGQPVLSLSLCDTSNADQDVYVGAALIAKGLAKPVVTAL